MEKEKVYNDETERFYSPWVFCDEFMKSMESARILSSYRNGSIVVRYVYYFSLQNVTLKYEHHYPDEATFNFFGSRSGISEVEKIIEQGVSERHQKEQQRMVGRGK